MPTTLAHHETRRGRDASRIAEIPRAGWKDILWRIYTEIGNDHVLLIGAGVTFYGLLALVPALTALVSIYGLFAEPANLDRHMAILEGLVPREGLDLVREQLRRLAEQGTTSLGWTFAAALAIALWSANSGMKAMFEAMNVAYDEEEKRGFVRLTAMTLAFTLATIATVLVLIGLAVVLPPILQVIGLGVLARWGARLGGIALVVLLMIVGLAALYRWGPSRHAARWRWITPGAVLAILVIMAASVLFSWYLASFASYNATYGSLGAVFGFMTWLWIAAIIVIVGAELNSEIEHQTRHDTTTGAPRPMGERGATMADTLGPAHGEREQDDHREPRPGGPEREPLALARLAALAALLWMRRRR
jgi:membrane protein